MLFVIDRVYACSTHRSHNAFFDDHCVPPGVCFFFFWAFRFFFGVGVRYALKKKYALRVSDQSASLRHRGAWRAWSQSSVLAAFVRVNTHARECDRSRSRASCCVLNTVAHCTVAHLVAQLRTCGTCTPFALRRVQLACSSRAARARHVHPVSDIAASTHISSVAQLQQLRTPCATPGR